MNRGQLVEQRKDGNAVHDRGFEEESLALLRGQVAEFAVGVDDGAFVGGDGVGSVFEGGADVIDGGLAVFHVERGGFEQDVGAGRGEPFVDVFAAMGGARFEIRCRHFAGGSARATQSVYIDALRVGDPAQASGGDSGDAEGDAVAVAEFSARSSSRRTRVRLTLPKPRKQRL